jgi:hypothetical protein
VQRGLAVLAGSEKIGNPDAKAREALFGRSQLSQGAPAKRRPSAAKSALRRAAELRRSEAPRGRRVDKVR